MVTGKRRGGFLATAEGVKKLKEAKRANQYTYEQIKREAKVTLDQVKRLFNPQWGDGKYRVGEEAVEAICVILDLKPEEIVAAWYAVDMAPLDSEEQELVVENAGNVEGKSEALLRIEQAARDGVEKLNFSSTGLTELSLEIEQLINLAELCLEGNSLSSLPPEIGQLTNLTGLYLNENSLSSLPPEIGQLTHLTHLDNRVGTFSFVNRFSW